VIDLDKNRLAHVRARFPNVSLGNDSHEALSDPRVNAVVVATPTSTHHTLIRSALHAGKHVLAEKPITTSSNDAEELCGLAARLGLVLMVGHVFVYNRAVQAVRRYVEDGTLGLIRYVSMIRTNLGPIRHDVNAAWDLASHDISIANYWLQSEPIAVSAVGGSWINPGIQDAVFATLQYPDDILVNLHVSWLNPRKAREITVTGERRMLTFDDMNLGEPIRIYDKQVTEDRITPSYVDSFASFRESIRDGDITIPKLPPGEPLRTECDHFLDCITKGTRPLTGGAEGLAVVRALEAIERSLHHAGRQERV